jgi:hypothetical protein
MDNDGRDDIVVLDQSKTVRVLYQGADGSFTAVNYGNVSNSNQWGMVIADFDNDGHKDVFSGGSYDGVHVKHIDGVGSATDVQLANGSMFMQACNFADIDNDGQLDAFGCHDDGLSRMWRGDGTALTPAPELIDLTEYALQNYPGNDHSGNCGSVWSDIDNDGDQDLMIVKVRQFVNDPFDPRRQNQLWVNDGNNFYTEQAADRGLVLNEQCWTADFADVDNDGDWDCFITTHSATMKLMINDGTGHFTDGTAASGLGVSGFCLQAKLADFDNDGYVDVVLGGGIHRYFHNDGDGTFTEVAAFPATDTMHSFALGDVNRDGFMDLYASYGNGYNSPDNGNPDRLWVNDANANHWIAFDLQGIVSNKDAVGAKVTITGSFGTQIREVRAGESYGITNTFHCMFGLGDATEVDQVTIEWPAGLTTVIDNLAIDQYHNLLEAECTVEVAVEASATEICPGTTATLTVPGDFTSIVWSNGSTDAVLEVASTGTYNATVFTAEGCAGVTASVDVVVVEPGVPQVTVVGELEFCAGSSAELIAPNGTAWLWSNDATTQSITVTESGLYSVSVQNECGAVVSSDFLELTVYPIPEPPVVQGASIMNAGSVSLVATGVHVLWYDAVDAITPVFSGNTFMTPILSGTTSFWVEDTGVAPVIVSGGELQMDAGQFHDNSARWMIFDAYEDLVLVSVKVFANGAGDRVFGVIDAAGNPVGSNVTVNVPDGESTVALGIEVPAGVGYGLRCYTGNPQLWRDGLGSTLNYPYALGSLASITQSTAGQQNALNYYYFFYDWVVEAPRIACPSVRQEVVVLDVYGCAEQGACNFDPQALYDDGSCVLPDLGFTCTGDCLSDLDLDGVCDFLEVAGCVEYEGACNYNINATDFVDCLIPTGCDFCLGNELVYESDSDLDGVCDGAEVSGCTYGIACNYNPLATDDDGSCLFYCPGCTLPGACNFDSTALQNNGSCVFAADIYGVGFVDCEGQCLHDLDSDGVCDELEIIGCMDAEACNFNPLATDSSDDCEVDGDGDGVCDSEEVMGCMLSTACNFDSAATEAGVCDFVSCAGCTYPYACNFNPQATLSNGTCVFGTCFGCTNPLACNFNPTVGGDDGSCLFENVCGECVSFTPVFTDCEGNCLHDFDGDGICDEEEIAGCTVVSACNFDPLATDENGTCVFAPSGYPCGTSCSGDANENGVDDSTELTNFYAQMENGGCGVWAVWNSELGTCVPNGCSGDFSGDLLVGTADLLVFLSLFGNDCSPQ